MGVSGGFSLVGCASLARVSKEDWRRMVEQLIEESEGDRYLTAAKDLRGAEDAEGEARALAITSAYVEAAIVEIFGRKVLVVGFGPRQLEDTNELEWQLGRLLEADGDTPVVMLNHETWT